MDIRDTEAMFIRAERYIEDDRTDEATEILKTIIEKAPEFGRAWNHLAYIYETKLRNFSKAEEMYRKCIELSPEYPAAYLNYAILLSTQERWEDQRKLISDAMIIPGINKAKLLNEQGIMYEMQGELEQAIYSYKAAIQKSFSDKEIEAFKRNIRRVEEKMKI